MRSSMTSAGGKRAPVWLTLLALGCYLLLRLPHLRDMPVFTDESTYARWAQLIAGDPVHELFVSMRDAKPPLHYWLLALGRPLAADAILAGRLLSVLFGALTLPLVVMLCGELIEVCNKESGKRRGGEGWRLRIFPGIACALFISDPLIALVQRQALAESLLLLEAVALAWLSLRWARLMVVSRGAPVWMTAAGLTFTWCLTLWTKQNFSYVLWLLPTAAMVLHVTKENWWGLLRRFVPVYGLATLIGLLSFVPVLFSDATYDLRTRVFYKSEFTASGGMIATISDHLRTFFVPLSKHHFQWWPYDAAHPLTDGWLYVYLTPPIFCLVVLGAVSMARRGQKRPLLFLAIWSAALLVPMIVGGGTLYPRYLLIGLFPFLLIPAFLLTDVIEWLSERTGRVMFPAAVALCIAAVLAMPTWAVASNMMNWQAPILAQADIDQLITHQSAGLCVENSVEWVRREAARHPVTIITGSWVGLPNDMLWLTFEHNPNVHLYWFNALKPLSLYSPAEPLYVLNDRNWSAWDFVPTQLPTGAPIYMFMPIIPRGERLTPLLYPTSLPPGTRAVKDFGNPADPVTHVQTAALQVLELPPPPAAMTAMGR